MNKVLEMSFFIVYMYYVCVLQDVFFRILHLFISISKKDILRLNKIKNEVIRAQLTVILDLLTYGHQRWKFIKENKKLKKKKTLSTKKATKKNRKKTVKNKDKKTRS